MPIFKILSSDPYQHTRQIINQELALDPPRGLIVEFTDKLYGRFNHIERLLSPAKAASMFSETYIRQKEDCGPKAVSAPEARKLSMSDYNIVEHENPSPRDGRGLITALTGHLEVHGRVFWTQGIGNGAIDCLNEILHSIGLIIEVLEYETSIIGFDSAIKLRRYRGMSSDMVVT
ncbi:2-isopropylmalate synthase [Penicillium odoratum]|uniref:2-isopropylmalate synthase n=1 Tax=Penicillium odoratum TaxID=1167516 RepID=UPI002547D1F9|nr:2-isopropylmalate synthase [Penicillium odoratum]KAJ5765013.1 2-isopropylmalate synthase [Penicillium odoratum]